MYTQVEQSLLTSISSCQFAKLLANSWVLAAKHIEILHGSEESLDLGQLEKQWDCSKV